MPTDVCRGMWSELAREIRALELLRLDAMHLISWPKVLRGDAQALDRVLARLDRHARIFGFSQDTAFQTTTRLNATGKVTIAGPQGNLSAEDQAIASYVNGLSESESTAIAAELQQRANTPTDVASVEVGNEELAVVA